MRERQKDQTVPLGRIAHTVWYDQKTGPVIGKCEICGKYCFYSQLEHDWLLMGSKGGCVSGTD